MWFKTWRVSHKTHICEHSLKKNRHLYLEVLKGSNLIGLARSLAKGAKSTCTNRPIPTPVSTTFHFNYIFSSLTKIKPFFNLIQNGENPNVKCSIMSSTRPPVYLIVLNQFWMKSGTFTQHLQQAFLKSYSQCTEVTILHLKSNLPAKSSLRLMNVGLRR